MRIWPTSYNGSDEGKEDVLLVADADLLVVHLHRENIFENPGQKIVERTWLGIDWYDDIETCIMQWRPAKRQNNAIEAVATTAQIPPIRMYTAEEKIVEWIIQWVVVE